MIIKGQSRAGTRQLGNYLASPGENERAELVEIRGTIARDVRGAMQEMAAIAAGTKCEKPLYHAKINPEPPYRLTPEQIFEAVEALEQKLGLADHARVVVVHEKHDRQDRARQHIHAVWTRIDIEKMRAVSDSHNYRKHEEVARDLERRFGHPRVQGAHAEREGIERPDRTPSRAELQQQERTGIMGKAVKAEVTAAFKASDGPDAFRAALEEHGYQLAQGDRRDYVVIDRLGGVHSLARRIEGMKVAELREFMGSMDVASLPSVERAREIAAERERRVREAAESRGEARIKKAYARGEDYVSQTRAAHKDHERRQQRLQQQNRKQRAPNGKQAFAEDDRANEVHDAAEKERASRVENKTTPQQAEPSKPDNRTRGRYDNKEMTDAQRARLERLLDASDMRERSRDRTDDDPDRQPRAQGGGRTRSR